MVETIIPAFEHAPEEGKIIGRLLAGYSDLEVEMLMCTDFVIGDIDMAVRELYGTRGEFRRIQTMRQLTEAAYVGIELGPIYATTMADMDWCRQIRNQYAHCQWYYTAHEGLCFIDLEELAKQPAKIVYVTNTPLPVNVSLLSLQEAFFKHVQKCFWYLQEQYRMRTGAIRPATPLWSMPSAMAQPPAHN